MKLHEVFAKKTYGPDPVPERSETGIAVYNGRFVKIYPSDTAQQVQRQLDDLRLFMDDLTNKSHMFQDPQGEMEDAEYDEEVLQRYIDQRHV